jgi:hypothetical protein
VFPTNPFLDRTTAERPDYFRIANHTSGTESGTGVALGPAASALYTAHAGKPGPLKHQRRHFGPR